MPDIDQQIRDQLPFDSDITDQNRHIDALGDALRAVLDLADDLCGDDDRHDTSAHDCGGAGEPNCPLCVAQSIEYTIARELGITEETNHA